jgi:hypothetical protein
MQSQNDHHIPIDVLRVIQEEANLMKETQEICDMLDADPMEQLTDIRRQVEHLKKKIQVTSCSRVRTGFDYSAIDAVVSVQETHNLQLTFKYERKPSEDGQGCQVWFSIEISHDYGEKIMLLLVQVFAAAGAPSTEKAVCLQAPEEESEGGWEGIDEDDENDGDVGAKAAVICSDSDSEASLSRKKQKTTDSPEQLLHGEEQKEVIADDALQDEEKATHDSFSASLDPEVLQDFLESAGLLPMSEATAFFLLMTLPFYEPEWDLVGYVLDEVFGAGSDSEPDIDED